MAATGRNDGVAPMRELFIEELADVRGGNPLDKVMWWVRENLVTMTTHACGEEGPGLC